MMTIKKYLATVALALISCTSYAGIYECTFIDDGSMFTCNLYNSGQTEPPTVPPGNVDPGYGSWWVTKNRMIADQSGNVLDKLTYVPGCINGEFTSSGSQGCATKTYNSNYGGFSFLPDKVLGIRYISNKTLSANRYFRISSGSGGSVGSELKAWISPVPNANWEDVNYKCRNLPGSTLLVATGGNYCPIEPNQRYYLFIRDDAGAAARYIIDETSSDLQ